MVLFRDILSILMVFCMIRMTRCLRSIYVMSAPIPHLISVQGLRLELKLEVDLISFRNGEVVFGDCDLRAKSFLIRSCQEFLPRLQISLEIFFYSNVRNYLKIILVDYECVLFFIY